MKDVVIWLLIIAGIGVIFSIIAGPVRSSRKRAAEEAGHGPSQKAQERENRLGRHSYLNKLLRQLMVTLDMPPGEPFVLSRAQQALLAHSYGEERVLTRIARIIFAHCGMPLAFASVTIEREDDSAPEADTRSLTGSYRKPHSDYEPGVITVQMKTAYQQEHMLAILCHECMHHLMYAKGIRLASDADNEVLTDIMAVYMGMGEQLLRGYAPFSIEVERQDVIQRQDSWLGYLRVEEVAYIMGRLPAMRSAYEERASSWVKRPEDSEDEDL